MVFMLNTKEVPIIVGINILIIHTNKLAEIINNESTPVVSKNNKAENSLTPKSLKKLNAGITDFAKKIKPIPILNISKGKSTLNNKSTIRNWDEKIR